MQLERAVPYAPESEVTVLGGMLLDSDAIPAALEIVRPEDFYVEANRLIARAVRDLFDSGAATDPPAVAECLRGRGELERAGGLVYLGELLDAVATARNIEYHARVVRDRAILRALIRAGRGIIQDATSDDGQSAADKLDRASQRLFELTEGRIDGGPTSIKHALTTSMDDIERRTRSEGGITGLPTGFRDLDDMTGGIQRGDLWIVAARPSMGKTSIVTGIALHLAISQKVGVYIASLEMSKEQIVQRMLAHEALVDLSRILRGRLRDDDYVRLAQAAGHLNEAPIWIDDRGVMSITALRAALRRMKAQHPEIQLAIIDYIQLMQGGDAENRNQEVSQISRGIKILAKDLGIGIVALSQLSRAPEQREDHRPRLSDLRESGALEQDADLVAFLYRPERYMTPAEALEKGVVGKAELIIAKQRNGPTDTVDLYFRKESARFEDYSDREAA